MRTVFHLQQSKLNSLYFTFIIGFCWTISVAIENDYVRNDRLSSFLADYILENFLNLNIGADVHAVMISFWLEQESSDAVGMCRKP